MLEDLRIFKVADLLASTARKTSAYARHPALPERVNLPSLQQFLVFASLTGNAKGTVLKHCMDERNDAYITSGAAEETPCSVSAATPSSRESTFSLSPWQGPCPAAKMKGYSSSLHPPFAPNLSPSFRWWKASWQDILKSIREMRCHLSGANKCWLCCYRRAVKRKLQKCVDRLAVTVNLQIIMGDIQSHRKRWTGFETAIT